MNAAAPRTWTDANQQLLVAEFAALRVKLGDTEAPPVDLEGARGALAEPAAIDQLTALFGLSRFERQVLLLAAGIEMDSALARLVPQLTFGLALARLDDAHWSAIGPMAPLRAWHLVELADTSPTQARLRIDERILHCLAGINRIDARLVPLLRSEECASLMAAEHRLQVDRALMGLRAASTATHVIQLSGDDADGRRDAAAEIAAGTGRLLYSIAQADLPSIAGEQDMLAMLWQREAALHTAALMIDADVRHNADGAALARFVRRMRGLVLVSTRDPIALPDSAHFRIDKPDAPAQHSLWLQALGGEPEPDLHHAIRAVASQFRLSATAIHRRAQTMAGAADARQEADTLWQACCEQSRTGLEELAQRVEASAGWDDLVLPPAQTSTLRQLAAQVRQRLRVHDDWGFGGHGTRGLGISALFCGESGVGKTMACEVLARELALDLYRIDLSSVVSKYIGETEKNLRQVFDAAEDSGAVLLFDEADSLFGKRSEVKDSHDRYANIEVGYLLQRMEAYRGLAVLTTNQRAALDPAFLRRLRFVVQFPFPDQALRESIWRRVFPERMPRSEIDFTKLARLQMAGGHIRNIAINAAFVAAEAGEPVTMAHLARAAHHEASKQERPLSEAQTRGWS